MNESERERVKELLQEAMELPVAERPAFLARIADPEVRCEVADLLRHAGTTAGPLDVEWMDDSEGDNELPERIGRYRILTAQDSKQKKLGKGGMGVVYEAEQESPRKRVALKVIRAGRLSPALLRRFEGEAEILAKLQHPGIAQVYEAGVFLTSSGPRPFFAMELIQGRKLSVYVREMGLSTRQRLELLVKICHAVQHAHGRRVIHRDLKPDNILVTDDGQPKVLDFGVARATDSDIKTTTQRADIGHIIGTLSYMSPEQAGGDPSDLDTRSDVYALGVIAYELLANRLPYNLNERALHEALRVIKEDEPGRLSTVSKTLRGDLEVIVGKALEKEKDRRYLTAEALAADIERYLHDETIAARPPSTWYQLSKFSRRNKGLVGGVVAAFVFLAAGLAATGIALKKESDQHQRAEEAEKKLGIERDRARSESTRATEVLNVFTGMLSSVRPDQSGKETKVYDVLLNSQSRASQIADPSTRAEFLETVGIAFMGLRLIDDAESSFREAYNIRTKEMPDAQKTIDSKLQLGAILSETPRIAEGQRLIEQACAEYGLLLGSDDENTVTALATLGKCYAYQHRNADAKRIFSDLVPRAEKAFPPGDPQTLMIKHNYATTLMDNDEWDAAGTILSDVLTTQEATGDKAGRAHTLGALGEVRMKQGRLDEARDFLTRARDSMLELVGPNADYTKRAESLLKELESRR